MPVDTPHAQARRACIRKWGTVSTSALLLASVSLTSIAAHAASPADADLKTRMQQLEQMLRAQEQRINQQEKRLAQQERTIAEQQKALTQQRGAPGKAQPVQAQAQAPSPAQAQRQSQAPVATPVAAPVPQPPQAPAAQTAAQASQPKRPEPPAVEQIANIGGVLLPKGGLILEPPQAWNTSIPRRAVWRSRAFPCCRPS